MSGYREDLWSFDPESGATMNVEYSTQIITAYDYSEQRVSRRGQPRYEFNANYYLIGQDVQQAKALMHTTTPTYAGNASSGLGTARMPWYEAPDIQPVILIAPGNVAAQYAFDNPGTPVVSASTSVANRIYWIPGGNVDDNTFPPFSQWYLLSGGFGVGDPTQGYLMTVTSSWTYEEIGSTGNFVNEAILSWGSSNNQDPNNAGGPFIPSIQYIDVYAYPILFGYLEGSLSSYRSEGNDLAVAQVKFSVQDTNRGFNTFDVALDEVENFRRYDLLGNVLDTSPTTLYSENFHADAANGGYPLVDEIPYLRQDSATYATSVKVNPWMGNALSTRFQQQRYGDGGMNDPYIGANPTTSELNFLCTTKEEALDLLRWLRDMRGKQKCFWRRSWVADFSPLGLGTFLPYNPGNPTADRILQLVIEPNGYAAPSSTSGKRLFYGAGGGVVGNSADNIENSPYQCVSLRFADGTYHNSIVLGVVGDDPGETPTFATGESYPGKHSLTLEWDTDLNDPFTNTHTYDNLLDVGYLHLCRFAEDSFSLVRDEIGVYRIDTTIVEGIKNVV